MQSDYTQFVRARLGKTILLGLAACLLAQAQGTAPRENAADYPVRAQLPGFELAAEYLVHGMPVKGGVIQVNDCLVLEVAIFPTSGGAPTVTSGEFTLRINGKKQAIYAQSPGMVAASLKYPDWESRPTLQGSAGLGDGGVTLGRPPVTSRFPGDPRPGQSRLPPQPKAPEQTNPSGAEKPAGESIEQCVARSSLPEGPAKGPVSGYLFFAFRGKIKSIRSLDLIYRSEEGGRETTLRLF